MEVCFYPLSVCAGTPGEPEGTACWLCIALGRCIGDEQTAEAIGGLVLFLRVASFPLWGEVQIFTMRMRTIAFNSINLCFLIVQTLYLYSLAGTQLPPPQACSDHEGHLHCCWTLCFKVGYALSPLLISSSSPSIPPRHIHVLFLVFRFLRLLGMHNSLSQVGHPPKELWNSTISVKLLWIIFSSSLGVAKPPTLLKQNPALKCMPYDGFVCSCLLPSLFMLCD